MKKNKWLVALSMLFILTYSSCGYKDSFYNKFYLYSCNYTDKEIELKFQRKGKTKSVHVQGESWKIDEFRGFLKKGHFEDSEVQLIVDGNVIENRGLTFSYPEQNVYSYCAYGGCYTRINISSDESGKFSMEFSYDLDPEPQLKQAH